MSSTTPNLNLVKLSGTENFSNANALAGNWDLIDAFAGECINKAQSGVSSISSLSNLLDSLLSAMPTNGVKAFQFGFSAVESPFTQATYFGTLYKSGTGTTYSSAVFRRCDQHAVISGVRNTNGWSFQQLALKSDVSLSSVNLTAYDNRVSFVETPLIRKFGNVCSLTGLVAFQFTPTSQQTSILVVPSGYIPSTKFNGVAIRSSDYKAFPIEVSTGGNINLVNGGLVSSGDRFYIGMTWIV